MPPSLASNQPTNEAFNGSHFVAARARPIRARGDLHIIFFFFFFLANPLESSFSPFPFFPSLGRPTDRRTDLKIYALPDNMVPRPRERESERERTKNGGTNRRRDKIYFIILLSSHNPRRFLNSN